MSDRCDAKIRLRDYGDRWCARKKGHDGDHFITSPYDSRDVRWSDPPAREYPQASTEAKGNP